MSDETEPDPDDILRNALVPSDEALLRYADAVRALVVNGLAEFPLRTKVMDTEPGAFFRAARSLLEFAEEVMEAAVIAERERGASWTELGEMSGGIARQTMQERWRGVMALWTESYQRMYRITHSHLHSLALAQELDEWFARLQPDPRLKPHAVTVGLAAGGADAELDQRAANASRTEARRLRREIQNWRAVDAHDAYLDACEAGKAEDEAREAWARPYDQLAELYEQLVKLEPAHAENREAARRERARAARIREAGLLDRPAPTSSSTTEGE